MIKPRPYQIEALEAVSEHRFKNVNRQLISLPTGCGKTVIFSFLAKEINVKTLVIAHTEELINQAVSKFKTVWPEVDIGIVKGKKNNIDSQVVVASIQTASKLKRLNELKRRDFGLLIIDEAHHATATSYFSLIKELGFFTKNTDKLLVGVTATPKRSDGVGLGMVFQEIVFERSISTMIRSGYLSPLVGVQVFTKVDLSNVGIGYKGDFVVSALSKIVNTPERNQLIVDNFIKYASDRSKALSFCVTVTHAKDLANTFVQNGIPAQAVYGDMPNEERERILSDFAKGKYRVLTNCQILTEGFDEPGIDCIIMGRPTQSSSLFSQMIGRGTRPFPLKKDCLILDFTDNASKHDLCTYKNTLNGAVTPLLPLRSNEYEKTSNESSDDEINEQRIFKSIKILEDRVEEISFFGDVHFAWTPVGNSWHLILSSNTEVWVRLEGDGYTIEALKNGCTTCLSNRSLPLDYALGVAEDWARGQSTSNEWAHKDAKWRSKPATQKQKDALSRSGIDFDLDISKGQASQLLDARYNEPATIKQIYWLRSHGIVFGDAITKMEAKKIIAKMR